MVVVVVCRAANLDIVVDVTADTVGKTKRLAHSHEEAHIVQVGRVIADPAHQGRTDEAMVASLRELSPVQRAVATERSGQAAPASHANGCHQKCADALGSLEATIQKALLSLEDEGAVVMTEVVVVAVAVVQLVEHTDDFGMKEEKYCFPWIHSDEAMPIFDSSRAEIHLLVSSNMMSVVVHHEASDGETVVDVVHSMKLGKDTV